MIALERADFVTDHSAQSQDNSNPPPGGSHKRAVLKVVKGRWIFPLQITRGTTNLDTMIIEGSLPSYGKTNSVISDF